MSNQSSNSSWKNQAGFVWSLIGSTVGFANILSFSAQVYKNGGGAFLIPYCLALLLLGIPLLILEGVIGSRLKTPLVAAYSSVLGSSGRVLGWLAVLACLTIGGFYIVLTGYSVAYTYFAATRAIPEDSQSFFINTFLNMSSDLQSFGTVSVPILISTLIVAAATWWVVSRGIKNGIERICSIFMPLLVLIMTLFAVIVTFLPGGIDGWVFYLKPNFSKLLDPGLWRDVFGQLFFSLSLGLGIIVGYSRHTGEQIDMRKAMTRVALGDLAVSFISGAAVFGCLAHISYTQGIPFESIVSSGSTFELGFIVFPKIFNFFDPLIGQALGVLFFFCIFIAGITGVFSIVESIAGNVEVEFKLSRNKAVAITIALITCVAVLFCMGNASHLIDALVPMVMGTNMLVGGLALILVFNFACTKIKQDPIWKRNARWHPYGFCLRYCAPLLLGIILAGNLWHETQTFDLLEAVRWGWFVLALSVSFFLAKLPYKRENYQEAS
jgi:neurotransmitter:Na+ symporter, NSS family